MSIDQIKQLNIGKDDQDEAYGSSEIAKASITSIAASRSSLNLKRKTNYDPRIKKLLQEEKDTVENEANVHKREFKKQKTKLEQSIVRSTAEENTKENFKCLMRIENTKAIVRMFFDSENVWLLKIESPLDKSIKYQVEMFELVEIILPTSAAPNEFSLKTIKSNFYFTFNLTKSNGFLEYLLMKKNQFLEALFKVSSFPFNLKVLSLAGFGGSSVVYYCSFFNSKRLLVTKIIKSGTTAYEREIRVFRKLQESPSPYLADLVGMSRGGVDSFLLITMDTGRLFHRFGDLKVSQDLFSVADLFPPGTFPKARLKEGFSQLVEGLIWLRNLGFSHGDVKDENVIVVDQVTNDVPIRHCPGNSWSWKWIDFGSSCCLQNDGGMVSTSHFLGTLHYAAPEILKANLRRLEFPEEVYLYDPLKQDIWSLGLLLFSCTFGVDAFSSPLDCLSESWKGRIPRCEVTDNLMRNLDSVDQSCSMESTLSKNFEHLLDRMLDKDPLKRVDLIDVKQMIFYD